LKEAGLQLTDAYISNRMLPLNFKHEDQVLFQHELTCEIRPSYLLKIKNIFYTGGGLVQVTLNHKLPESFLLYNFIQRLPLFRYLFYTGKRRILQKVETIRHPVVFVVDHWSYGYFHWMAEVLPRLVAAKNKMGNHPVVLPAKFKMLPFVSASLKQIGIDFRFLEQDCLYKLRNVVFISHFAETGNYNDLVLRKTRQLLYIENNKSIEKRCVYISRKNAGKRSILNEVQIIPILKSFKFEIVFAEELSFNQQQILFSSTDILVANHGAGLTNMLFMKPKSMVLELRCKNDTLNNCYFSLASALQLDYYYLNTEPVNQGENPHIANVIVNAHELNKLLQLIITGNN